MHCSVQYASMLTCKMHILLVQVTCELVIYIGKHGRSREHQCAIPIAEQNQVGSTTLELFKIQYLKQEKAILAAITKCVVAI